MPEAIKPDKGKTDWSLLPLRCMEEVMKVYTWGANRHDREKNQWRYGTKWSRYWNASMRHLIAFWRGEDIDPESGLHHLAHAVCSIMMLFEMTELKQHDDRENWMGEKIQPVIPRYREIQKMHSFKTDSAANNIWCMDCGQEKEHFRHFPSRERAEAY